MNTRTLLAFFACSALSQMSAATATVTDSYRFTTPQTEQSMQEAAMMVKTTGELRESSFDLPTATLTFSGPEEGVALAAWLLPQIDKAAGDNALHEYNLPSGNVARVVFVGNAGKPQEMIELLTIIRTLADVQKIFSITSNHALVIRAPE